MPNHLLELAYSWYLASSCWCLALSCARSQFVEGELYPRLMTVIRGYCPSCRLRPFLSRLHQLRRTIQYHYFHFDHSPLQELVRAEGGSVEDAGEVTSSFPCSRSSGITLRYVVFGSCVFLAGSTCGTSTATFSHGIQLGSFWSSPLLLQAASCALCCMYFAAFCICIVI